LQRDRDAFLAHALKMKFDRFSDKALCFFTRVTDSNNARKIWNVGSPKNIGPFS